MESVEETLNKLDPDIQNLAKRWARDCPDVWEDLAQEARLGIYQELKKNPACPREHLFHHAKHKIIDYRRKGTSVDGRLQQTHRRAHVWKVVSLDANPEEMPVENSILHFMPHQPRPVEDLALTRVAYGELRGRLSEPQRQYLALRLQGYSWREANKLLGLTTGQGDYRTKQIKRQAKDILLAS